MEDPLDVRDQPRAERRDRVFDRLERADSGETLSITADTDVRPSLAQYRIERGTALEWTLERDGPETREVDVTKRTESAAGLPEFDVREIPPQRRHEVLTDTFDRLEPGQGFVLVNDHDPKPLYHQFEAESGPEFHWEYRAKDPGEFCVLIGKTDTDGETASTATTARSDAAANDGPQAPF